MGVRFRPAEEAEPDDEEEDQEDALDDSVPALLAALVYMMSCPRCEGTGATGSGKNTTRCECRDASHQIALAVLKEEGLVG